MCAYVVASVSFHFNKESCVSCADTLWFKCVRSVLIILVFVALQTLAQRWVGEDGVEVGNRARFRL